MNCNTMTTTFLPSPTLPTTTPFPSTRLTFKTRHLQTRAITLTDVYPKPVSHTSFYDLLGIPKSGSLPEIKHAYKQLARVYHPDVSPPTRIKENTERFIRVKEAYETLSDPTKRAVYDWDLSCSIHLAFAVGHNMYSCDEDTKDESDYRTCWQSQVSELQKRSIHRDARRNMSVGARMRRQRN